MCSRWTFPSAYREKVDFQRPPWKALGGLGGCARDGLFPLPVEENTIFRPWDYTMLGHLGLENLRFYCVFGHTGWQHLCFYCVFGNIVPDNLCFYSVLP